jgi:hypothetical protein
MTSKELCEVLSNNKGYYKEIFDYWTLAKTRLEPSDNTKIQTIKSQK